MAVVGQFSKSVHFVPLPKLPSAAETGRLLVQDVFGPHGILQDRVSDRMATVHLAGVENLLLSPRGKGKTLLWPSGSGGPVGPGVPPSLPRSLASGTCGSPPLLPPGTTECQTAAGPPAAGYCLGQQVWPSSRDLPVQITSRKLAPRFVGPFGLGVCVRQPLVVRLLRSLLRILLLGVLTW